jgi:D-3-phosphoglycerate dehydrogenase
MAKVLITPAPLAKLEGPFLQTLRAAGFEIGYPPVSHQLSEEELLKELQGVSASLAGSEPYTKRVLDAHPQLRVIARAGVGYDAVDVSAASERAVAVCIAPGTNQDSVAEHTFAMLLAITRRIVDQHNRMKTGGWPRNPSLPLRGATLGIAGLGRIGKAVAIRGACFGMRLLAFEPFPDQTFVQQHHITLVSLERLLTESDYLSLHVPLSPESKYMINKKSLAMMKPSAILINTARGGLINEQDLYEALRAGKIAAAGLDVFEQEPPGKNPLLELDNVLLTAHTAGVDLKSRDDMALSAAQAIVALSRGEWPAHQIVNAEIRERFRWK